MRKFIAVGFLFYISALLVSVTAQISSIPSSTGSVSQAYETVEDEGTPLTQRNTINFTGAGVTCTDDAGNSTTDCDIPGGAAGQFQTIVTDMAPTISTTSTTDDTLNIAAGRCWGVSKSAATARITAGTGSGSYVAYCSSSGAYVVLYSTSAGLTLTCTGVTCTDDPSPAIPEGLYPIASGSISANTPSRWGTPTNLKEFSTRFQFLNGTGMLATIVNSIVTLAVDSSLVQMIANDYTPTAAFDASGATSTKSFKIVTSDPGTCAVGEYIFRSDTGATKVCTALNTWTTLAGSSYNPVDQTVTILRDEFASGSTTSGSIGTLNWFFGNVAGSGSGTNQTASGDHYGIYRITSGAITSDEVQMQLSSFFGPWDTITNWDYYYIVSIPTVTSVRAVVGLLTSYSGGATTNRITARFDTSVPDSVWRFETCSAGVCTTGDSTITPTAGSWHRIRIRSTVAGTIRFSVDGETEVVQNTNVPSVSTLLPAATVLTRTTAARSLDLDWFAFYRTGLSR